MMDERDYGKYIEGEYEVIDERDAESVYHAPNSAKFIEIDSTNPYITYSILVIIIGVWFVLMSSAQLRSNGLSFDQIYNLQLYLYGAKVNEFIAEGQSWRLFTAIFLHANLPHLFFNSYALYIYGPVVERLFGKIKFILIFVVSGLMGSLLSYLFSPRWAVGASGAIFGLMGSLLYFRQRNQEIFKKVFGRSLIFIIAINLIYGFTTPGIDNLGHIGGLAGGYLAANAVDLYKENPFKQKNILIWCGIIAIFTAGLWFGQKLWLKQI